MIRIHLQNEDINHVRFGISPLAELVTGLRVALSPSPSPIHAPWAESARAALAKLNLEPFKALVRPVGYMPDFLTPPPIDGTPSLSTELERLRSTPAQQVRMEVERVMSGSSSPGLLSNFIEESQEAVGRLADLLERCWSLVLEPHWPRIQALHESDITPRARKLAVGDTAGVLDNLHPITCFNDGVLELRQPLGHEPSQPDAPYDICLEGRGLLLVPEVFTWPKVSVILEQYLQPSLYYCPRGVANLWGGATLSPSEALAFALGHQRAGVLMAVSNPSTTQDVARVLKVTAGNVSHHLGRLRKAGLIEVQRDGRLMFYSLSAKGKALLELFA